MDAIYKVEGAELSPLMRAIITADFCNGTSAFLPFKRWAFINADLTLSLAREPVGEWILLDAETWGGPDSIGIAAARLADRRATSAAPCRACCSKGAPEAYLPITQFLLDNTSVIRNYSPRGPLVQARGPWETPDDGPDRAWREDNRFAAVFTVSNRFGAALSP